jgi:hypothetical protein
MGVLTRGTGKSEGKDYVIKYSIIIRGKLETSKMEILVDLSGFQELLASLYLRLNGYITSSFIVHAPTNNYTEVDILGVRFRHNAEPEREVTPSEYIQIPDTAIDIVICEVKGRDIQLQFTECVNRMRQL